MFDHSVTLVVLALSAAATAAPVRARAQQPPAAAPAAHAQRIDFTVVGLSCPFCAYGIEKRLRREVVGLDSLGLDFKTGIVTLEVRDGVTVTDEQLEAAVKKAGFSVQGDIQRSPLAGTRGQGPRASARSDAR